MPASRIVIASALSLLVTTPALAQRRDDVTPHLFVGASLGVAEPTGEFADYVDTAFGAEGHFLARPGRGQLALRIDGGYVNYGREHRSVMLSPTVGGRVTVDLNTTNDILFLGAGPQIGVPGDRLQPYVNGTVGLAYFTTSSSLRGDRDDESFANTTNYDDATLSYGAGAGLYVPLRRGSAPISLDLGVRFHRSADVSYLREGDITDNPDGTISVFPVESDANLFTFQLGVSAALRRSGDRDGDGDDDRRRRRRR